jgi:hypothetical protein
MDYSKVNRTSKCLSKTSTIGNEHKYDQLFLAISIVMINKITYLVIFALLISCGSKHKPTQSLIGEYKDKDIGVFEHLYLKYFCNELVTVGNSLILRTDSSYTYSSCNMIINGRWSIQLDSLNLDCSDIRWKNDSMNVCNPLQCQKPIHKVYITEQGELKDRIEVRFNNKLMHAITWMSKN